VAPYCLPRAPAWRSGHVGPTQRFETAGCLRRRFLLAACVVQELRPRLQRRLGIAQYHTVIPPMPENGSWLCENAREESPADRDRAEFPRLDQLEHCFPNSRPEAIVMAPHASARGVARTTGMSGSLVITICHSRYSHQGCGCRTTPPSRCRTWPYDTRAAWLGKNRFSWPELLVVDLVCVILEITLQPDPAVFLA